MIFALPGLLWLLPAALLPVIFHFLFPRRSGKLIFPTLMFFYRADPLIARRNRLRQWLILLCRVLVLFFLILALTRPTIMIGQLTGHMGNSLIILDDTASMSRQCKLQPQRSCFNIACAAALTLAEGSGKDNLGIITLSDARFHSVTEGILPGELLGSCETTAASGNMPLAIAKGIELLRETGGTIHIFSDCQSHEFEAVSSEIQAGSEKVILSIHRILAQQSEKANVVVKSVKMPASILLPGHPVNAEILLQNNSPFDASNITVTVAGLTARPISEIVSVNAGTIRPVSFQLMANAIGFQPVAISLSGDGFPADDQAAAVWYCHEPVKVLFAGGRSDYGFIPLALSPLDEPALTGIEMVFRSVGKIIEYCQLNEVAMVVMTHNVSLELENAVPGWQKAFLDSGGNVLLVPSIANASGQDLPDYYDIRFNSLVNAASPLPLELNSLDSMFWYMIFGQSPQKIDKLSISSYYPLILSDNWQSLLSCDLSQSVLAYRQMGKGNVFVSGFALDNRSSTLPKSPLMVVVLQNMVTAISSASTKDMSEVGRQIGRTLNLYAGDTLEYTGIAEPVEIVSLSGIDKIEQGGKLSELPIMTHSGVLRLDYDGGTMAVAFSSDPSEAYDNYLSEEQLVSQLEGMNVFIDTITYHDNGNYLSASPRRLCELYVLSIVLSLVFFLCEAFLSNKRIWKADSAGARR